MKTFQDLLTELDACSEAKEWTGDKTIEQVVADCERGDWLLWLGQKIEIDIRKLTLAKGYCANTVRHLMKDERSTKAVDAAIKYEQGKLNDKELNAAADAAYCAAYANAAAYAAAYAAYCAAYAAYCAAYAADYAAYAADYAADATYCAVSAVADATYCAAYAKKENQMQTADICREYIGDLIIEKINELLTN